MNAQVQPRVSRLEDTYLPGAHLVTERKGYAHHGIYVGEGRVIHYTGFCHALHAGPVEETALEDFAGGHGVTVKSQPCACYSGAAAVSRARSRLGEDRYHLLTNNCEHFCTWCLLGQGRSEQVETCLRHPGTAMVTVLHLALALLSSIHRLGATSRQLQCVALP